MKKEYIVDLREEEADELMDEHLVGELVRCKDCKWYSEKGFCKHPNGGAGNVRPADWFCADGERREKL